MFMKPGNGLPSSVVKTPHSIRFQGEEGGEGRGCRGGQDGAHQIGILHGCRQPSF